MGERTQEQVIGEIRRQREELVSAVTETRRDLSRRSAPEAVAMRQLPVVGVAVGVIVLAVVARKGNRSRHASPVAVERLRIGRFSLLERI